MLLLQSYSIYSFIHVISKGFYCDFGEKKEEEEMILPEMKK
jgi:hypothetical protein